LLFSYGHAPVRPEALTTTAEYEHAKKILRATTIATALMLAVTAPSAHAAPILGSHVDSQVFLNSIAPNTEGWAYLGPSLLESSPLWIAGKVVVKSRSSTSQITFGYSDMNYQNKVEVVGAGSGAGAIFDLGASVDQRLFYFEVDGIDLPEGSDDNTQFTGGTATGEVPGIYQGGIDIFYHANSKTWALFFDDGAGGVPVLGDDNDYDDLIITFGNHSVPEPGAIGLMSLALFGRAGGVIHRRRQKAVIARP